MLVVGAFGIDPTVVRDERQTDFLLKCGETPGKNGRVRLVFEKTTVSIPFLGRQIGISRLQRFAARALKCLGAPPAIELALPEPNALVAVALHHRPQRGGKADPPLAVIPICTADL